VLASADLINLTKIGLGLVDVADLGILKN